ncbi:MAG: peroxiredoxin family protein [Planctomycetota bacterium]
MAEQPKRTNLWPALLIAVIILGAVAIWRMAFYTPVPPVLTEHPQTHEHSPEPLPQSSRTQNPQKIRLRDVIAAARTWGPTYKSWVGQTAPNFTLTDINGKEHKLADYRGKHVMLTFWATWCAPCVMEVPHLKALRDTVGQDELGMLAISYITAMPPNTTEMIKDFTERNRLNYTVLSTDMRDMPAPFDSINAIPSSFFINPDGKIKLATAGALSLSDIKAILQAE